MLCFENTLQSQRWVCPTFAPETINSENSLRRSITLRVYSWSGLKQNTVRRVRCLQLRLFFGHKSCGFPHLRSVVIWWSDGEWSSGQGVFVSQHIIKLDVMTCERELRKAQIWHSGARSWAKSNGLHQANVEILAFIKCETGSLRWDCKVREQQDNRHADYKHFVGKFKRRNVSRNTFWHDKLHQPTSSSLFSSFALTLNTATDLYLAPIIHTVCVCLLNYECKMLQRFVRPCSE